MKEELFRCNTSATNLLSLQEWCNESISIRNRELNPAPYFDVEFLLGLRREGGIRTLQKTQSL